MMNIKTIIGIANKFPGFDLKQVILGFVNNLTTEIQKQETTNQKLNENNRIVVMTYTTPQNELMFVPVEVTQPTAEEPSKIVNDFKPVNLNQIIQQTDINKAVDLLSDDNNKQSFFEVLEACKI